MKTINDKISLRSLVLFITLLMIGLTACQNQKKAIGLEDEILVVADSSEYDVIEPELYNSLSSVIYTPQPENIFNLRRISVNQLNAHNQRKNIIIAAPLNSNSYTSQYINSILGPEVKELVKQDSASIINRHDLWYKNQLVTIITAKDMETLKKEIIKNRKKLLSYFQMKSNDRLSQTLYNTAFENKKMEGQLLKDNGWIINCQKDFTLAKNDTTNNFVWLRRGVNTDMERWLFIHWIENASPAMLEPDTVFALRDSITKDYYRTTSDDAWVQIRDEYLATSEVNFNNRYAIMTQGLWYFTDKGGGGPFVNYTFFDEKSGRLYMVDGSVYAPKYKKKGLIQQVDVLLHSFRTKDELSQDRIEDLLSYLED